MKKAVIGAIAGLGLFVSGCTSTRGGQDIACADYDQYVKTAEPSGFVADIQRYAPDVRGQMQSGAGAETLGSGELEDLLLREVFGKNPSEERARAASAGAGAENITVTRIRPARNLLLLSGGGQWGAYGAGLFLGMACTAEAPANRNEIPCMQVNPGADPDDFEGETRTLIRDKIDFTRIDDLDIGVITGVSTGGLQSLLLSVVLDRLQLREARLDALEQLLESYAPASEDELVDRNGFFEAAFTGSVAGTDALREHVRDVLQIRMRFQNFDALDKPKPELEQRLVDQIGEGRIVPVVGFVAGADGKFKYVNMKDMVANIELDRTVAEQLGQQRPRGPNDAATNCVLATTLASAAMPVFHQQLRVMKELPDQPEMPSTLFDGGVRRSVFIGGVGHLFKSQIDRSLGDLEEDEFEKKVREDRVPRIYVLRNGPTTSSPAKKAKPEDTLNEIDDVTNAQPQAMRAYSLLVNELEVGSIAALRLANPYGPIDVSTADGSEDNEAGAQTATDSLARLGCTKGPDEMFSPAFMRCLQNFGARRGMEIERDGCGELIPAFWSMRRINAPASLVQSRCEPVAANDDEPAGSSSGDRASASAAGNAAGD